MAEPLNEPSDKWVSRSGATSSGKLAGYDMIPEIFLTRLAGRFSLGEKKHGKFNYRKGLQDKEYILERLNHAMLHLKLATDQIQQGVAFEDDDLGAVACNIAMAMEYQAINDLMEPSQLVFRTKDQWIRTLNAISEERSKRSETVPVQTQQVTDPSRIIVREEKRTEAIRAVVSYIPQLSYTDVQELIDYLKRYKQDMDVAKSPG